jgi:Nuclease-related domain
MVREKRILPNPPSQQPACPGLVLHGMKRHAKKVGRFLWGEDLRFAVSRKLLQPSALIQQEYGSHSPRNNGSRPLAVLSAVGCARLPPWSIGLWCFSDAADRKCMARLAGQFPQSRIRQRRKAFFRQHWWRVLLVGFFLGVIVVGVALVLPHWSVPGWAVVLLMVLAAASIAQSQIDGTYYLVAARDTERWTSKDLRRLLGRSWHVVDGIHFWHGDVDHLVVGPTGVYLVETKHTDPELDLNSRRGRKFVASWAEAVRRRTRSTRLLLKSHGVDIEPLIVIWGGQVTGTPSSCDGMRILHRSDLPEEVATWKQRKSMLTSTQVDLINTDLLAHRMRQESYTPST